MRFHNYVVCFSDGRLKVGVTSNVHRRMSEHIRHGKQSGCEAVTWWSSNSFENKVMALNMERLVCSSLGADVINGHRELFVGTPSMYAKIIRMIQYIRPLWNCESPEDERWGWWSLSGRIGQ